MARTRRKFTREFKIGVVREVEAGKTVAQAAREHQVHPTQIDQWRRDLRRCGAGLVENKVGLDGG